MRTDRAEALIRRALTEGRVQPFIRSKVRKHIEAPMTQMLLGEPQVKQMAAALARHGFTHDSSMAFNSKVAHHKFKRGHRLITVTRFKEPEGNRVVWSSAGLTGHGQDGRGEHYTTLTTHLRAITPRRVHEESARFRTKPAPSIVPGDWADHHNRAWISPEGKTHQLLRSADESPWYGETHTRWAIEKQHVHGLDVDHGGWGVVRHLQDHGWIRKTAKDFYDIGDRKHDDPKALAIVHKHFTTHHPELDSVRVLGSEGVHTLYKGLNEEANDGRERFDFSGVDDFEDVENRAWIEPKEPGKPGKDTVHKIGQQTHYAFAREQLRGETDPSVRQYFDTAYKELLNRGWVRKISSKTYHVADEKFIPRVQVHLWRHHPEVKTAAVAVSPHAMARDAKIKYVSNVSGDVYEETSRFNVEQSLDDIPGDWEDSKHRAWLSPKGKLHKLKQGTVVEPWLGQTHQQWAVDNEGVHGLKTPEEGWGAVSLLQQNGWIRKPARNVYDIGRRPLDDATLATVHKHFTKHHPELRAVNVLSRDGMHKLHKRLRDPAAEKAQADELARHLKQEAIDNRERPDRGGDFEDSENRAWISPEGKLHPLGPDDENTSYQFPTATHYRKASKILGRESPTAKNQYDDFNELMAKGWVRKVSRRSYQAQDPQSGAKIVHQHIVKHHPDVNAALVTGHGAGQTTKYTFVSKDGEMYEALDGRPRPMISMDFDEPEHRAWLSPEGDLHPLGKSKTGVFSTATHYDKAAEILGHSDAGPSQRMDDFESLLGKGWVRKVSSTTYMADRPKDVAHKIHQHITKHHPDVETAIIRPQIGSPRPWVYVSKHGEVYESEHSWKDEFGELGDFAQPQHRAWISPEGKLHPLGRDGQETHGGWITRVRGPNAFTEYEDMTKAGWVRKVNPSRYSGGRHAVKNALAHARQYHPEVGRILFTVADQTPYREYVIDTKTGSGVKRGLKKPMTPVHEVYE